MPEKSLNATTENLTVNLQNIPYQTDLGIRHRAAIGLIVLSADHTIEYEFRKVMDIPGVAFYETRIHSAAAVTQENLAEMEAKLAACASLILPEIQLDVIAFGCTSASMVIGEKQIETKIKSVRAEVQVTNPITAVQVALKSLKAQNVALLTPYRDDINQLMRKYLIDRGFRVPVMGSFNEENDNIVGQISPESIRDAVIQLGENGNVDTVFVSCTNLRLVEDVVELEEKLGKPVISSNQALAWHCLRLSGVNDKLPQFGKLYMR